MTAFLTVTAKSGEVLRDRQPFKTLDEALHLVSGEYLADAPSPYRYSGFVSIRSGEITHMKIESGTGGVWLRSDIAQIDIYSARGLLEIETFGKTSFFTA